MFAKFRRMRWLVACLLLGIASVAAAYTFDLGRLSQARQFRRDDSYSLAEEGLARCWRLPGLSSAIALEEHLIAVQQGDLRDQATWQKRAAKRSPTSFMILEALAKGNLAAFQWMEAKRHADEILDRQPEDAWGLWLRGRAYVEMQREEEARRDLERALEIEPEASQIRHSLADLLHDLGYARAATVHYEVLHRKRPEDERVMLALARCWQEGGRLNEARELLDQVLAYRPDWLAGLVERGRLALRMREPNNAERWLRQAIELSPDHADANLVLRLALQAQKKTDSVLDGRIEQNERLQAELKLRLHELEHKAPLLTEVGRRMARSGQEGEAASWYYSALRDDASYAPAHLGLAEFFAHTGQVRRANLHARLGGGELKKPSTREVIRHAKGKFLSAEPSAASSAAEEATSEEVHRLCAACHAYPLPETMPRSAWRKEVKQGYDFLRASALAGDYPSLESVVLYYERRAPEQLPALERCTNAGTPPIKFEKRGTGWLPRMPPQPAVTNASLARLFGSANQELLLCETRLDSVLVLRPYVRGPGGMVLRQVTAPCHASVCDMDGDGTQDILVASLGNFFPTDARVGKVLWLRNKGDGQFEAKSILDGIGRVADVRAADFSGDGKLDLVVAAFGWRAGGEILYLENRTTDWTNPRFDSRVVDSRHGAIHVPVADLNGDGRPDFLALISQEHESVAAYLNQRDGTFQQATIFSAPHPSYGSSGIEVVDLDDDRDLDVVLTNGDILDRPHLLKPYHGVQWLENEGSFPFKHHPIAAMYGVSRAVAADFDGDGDQDVAAVSLLPRPHFPEREKLRLPSVVLLEQTAKTQFAMHTLETGTCDHFSCAAGDWDGDGRVDLAVANFCWDDSQTMSDGATLWRNVGKP